MLPYSGSALRGLKSYLAEGFRARMTRPLELRPAPGLARRRSRKRRSVAG